MYIYIYRYLYFQKSSRVLKVEDEKDSLMEEGGLISSGF